MTPKVQAMLQRHALARLELETRQALQWYEFYQEVEPDEQLAEQWLKTLRHRISIEMAAQDNVSNSTTTT